MDFILLAGSAEADMTNVSPDQSERGQNGRILKQAYNRQRLHSALDYLTPEGYETKTKPEPAGSIPLAPAPIHSCP